MPLAPSYSSGVALTALLVLSAGCGAGAKARPGAEKPQTFERDAALPERQGAIGGSTQDESGGALAMVSVQAERDGKSVAHDISNHEGIYRLGPLPAGLYDVRAKFGDGRVFHQDIRVEPGKEAQVPLRIDLGASADTGADTEASFGAIEGQVLDGPHGNPFPGVVVSLTAPHLSDAVMAFSDETGTFRYRNLRPGTYAVGAFYTLVSEGSVELRHGRVQVRAGETTSITVAFDLKLQ